MKEVIIDGIRYIPEPEKKLDDIRIRYTHILTDGICGWSTEQRPHSNIRMTFNDGKLIKAEVL